MPKYPSYRGYKALAGLFVLAGGGGMCLSLLHMACAEIRDIIAGAAGCIAGAVLAGSGVIALALLARTTGSVARDADPSAPEDAS